MPSSAVVAVPVQTQSPVVPSLEREAVAEAIQARVQPEARGVRMPLVVAVHRLLMEHHGDMDVVTEPEVVLAQLAVMVAHLAAEAAEAAEAEAVTVQLAQSESFHGR